MDFEYSDDQRMLADSIARLLADRYDFAARRGYQKQPEGWSGELWSQYAELGLLGVPFDEAMGGFGGGAIDVMMVMEAFGRALVLEPYLASIVLGGAALRHGGTAEQQAELLPQMIDGSLKLAFAHSERQSRYDLADVVTTARRDGGGWVLDGAKSVVFHGDSADRLIVSARDSGERHEEAGITLFLVDANAPGVARRGYALHDGTRAAEIALAEVRVPDEAMLGQPDEGLSLVRRVHEAGIAAMAAEMVGCMEAMHAMTLDYSKTRQQFGKPIGTNQVVQHRLAEMLVELEQGRSMAMLGAMSLDEPDPALRARNMSMVKLAVGQSARFVSQNAVQLHGGIGMTEEYAVGHYFRRAMVFEHSFGDCAYHLGQLAAGVE